MVLNAIALAVALYLAALAGVLSRNRVVHQATTRWDFVRALLAAIGTTFLIRKFLPKLWPLN